MTDEPGVVHHRRMPGADGKVQYAPHDGGHVAYRTWGAGPPLLYVPSQFIAISDMDDEPAYERFLHALAQFATVIAFDRRGIGLSDPMDGPPTIDGWIDQLVAVIDATGVEQAHVLGHAVGAVAAIGLAVREPARVASLVLAMGLASFEPPEEMLGSVLGAARPGTEPEIDFLANLAPSRAGDARFREWWDRAGRRGASPAVAQALLGLQSSADASAIEPRVTVPTVVIERPAAIWGGFGARRPAGLAIPSARFVEVDGVDWLPWLPDSEAVVAEIEEVITGGRSERLAARVLLTVMFTDVVGSTDSAVRLGDAGWRDVLETHDRVLRRELERHGGTEVDSAGDGFLATFPTPTQAVRCAARLHRAMDAIGVMLRIGIHCGEVEVRDRNYAGVSVHLAARVQAKAAPGQTLVTSTVREAMIGSGARTSPVGTFELKGIPDRWDLFAVEP